MASGPSEYYARRKLQGEQFYNFIPTDELIEDTIRFLSSFKVSKMHAQARISSVASLRLRLRILRHLRDSAETTGAQNRQRTNSSS